MQNRFKLQKSESLPDWWVLTDIENMIVVRWEQGKFNDTQKVSPIEDADLRAKFGDNLAQELARIMAEIADYLRDFHYEKVFELNDRQRLGAKIMALRNERGYSISALAELCDVNKATIVNIEQGKFSPRYEIVERIVKELGGTIEIK
jgi:DNA-binding XRE family transcriptional regulator